MLPNNLRALFARLVFASCFLLIAGFSQAALACTDTDPSNDIFTKGAVIQTYGTTYDSCTSFWQLNQVDCGGSPPAVACTYGCSFTSTTNPGVCCNSASYSSLSSDSKTLSCLCNGASLFSATCNSLSVGKSLTCSSSGMNIARTCVDFGGGNYAWIKNCGYELCSSTNLCVSSCYDPASSQVKKCTVVNQNGLDNNYSFRSITGGDPCSYSSCVDSDGSTGYSTWGWAANKTGYNYTDACVSSTALAERSCSSSAVSSSTYACPSGLCGSGACCFSAFGTINSANHFQLACSSTDANCRSASVSYPCSSSTVSSDSSNNCGGGGRPYVPGAETSVSFSGFYDSGFLDLRSNPRGGISFCYGTTTTYSAPVSCGGLTYTCGSTGWTSLACTSNSQCDDGNGCTDNVCSSGVCTYPPITCASGLCGNNVCCSSAA